MNINKVAGLLIGAATLLAGVSPALAASISNPLFSNGQTSIDATGGATVSGTFTLTVGPGEVVEYLRTQSDGSQPFVDTSVNGTLGYQEGVYIGVPFSVKVPPNTGTYWPTVQGAGAYGGNRAINGGDSVAPSTISLGSTNLGSVRVVANGSTDSTPVPGGSNSDDFWTKMAALFAAAFKSSQPTVTPVCAQLATYNYLSYGSVGSNVIEAQTYVMAHGGHISAISSGSTGKGFWGSQSAGALGEAKGVNSCN